MGVIVEYDTKTNTVKPPYTTGDYTKLVGTDHLVNPDLSGFVEYFTSAMGRSVPYTPFRYIVLPKYWKYDAGSVVEMDQTEKDAVDSAESTKQVQDIRQATIDELNRNRTLKAALLVILDEMNLQHGTSRTPSQFLNAIVNKINNGEVD